MSVLHVRSVRALLSGVKRFGAGVADLNGTEMLAWFAVAVIALYQASAVFPSIPVEGDDQGIVNGVLAWQYAREDFAEVAYNYAIHPGSFHLVSWFAHALDAHPMRVFCVLSAIGAAIFSVLSAGFVSKVCGCRTVWVLLAFLTVQEFSAAAYYANSSALAAPFLCCAMLYASNGRRFAVVGLLLGIAAWIRLDALLVSPAVLGIAYSRFGRWRDSVFQTSQAALAACFTLWCLFSLSDASLSDSMKLFQDRDDGASWSTFARLVWFVASPVWLLVSLSGVFALVWRKQWPKCILFVAGVLLPVAVYGRSFTTTKYLYFALPFAAIPAAELLTTLWRAGSAKLRIIFGSLIFGVLLEGLIGVRSSSSEFRRFDLGPSDLLISFRLWGRDIQVGPVEGEVIPTHDGFRVRGALFHAPRVWRRLKEEARNDLQHIEKRLLGDQQVTFIATTYLSWQLVDGIMIEHGADRVVLNVFPYNAGSRLDVWSRGDRALKVYKIKDERPQRDELRSIPIHPGTYFLNDRGANAAASMGVEAADWTLESSSANGLLTLLRRE